MKKHFTHDDAAKLVDCAVELAKTTATDDKGPQPVAVCCMKAEQGVMGVPTAYRRMDSVKATSATFAIHKAHTVLLYQADTKKHTDRLKDGTWSEADMILMWPKPYRSSRHGMAASKLKILMVRLYVRLVAQVVHQKAIAGLWSWPRTRWATKPTLMRMVTEFFKRPINLC